MACYAVCLTTGGKAAAAAIAAYEKERELTEMQARLSQMQAEIEAARAEAEAHQHFDMMHDL